MKLLRFGVNRCLRFSFVTVFACATICGAVAQTTPEEIEARAAQEKAAREAEILAVVRALPKPYLEVAPRERSMTDVPQPEERLVWATETGLREIRSENPNRPVIDKLLGACANGPPDARVREFAEAVLAFSLPSDPSPKWFSVIGRACRWDSPQQVAPHLESDCVDSGVRKILYAVLEGIRKRTSESVLNACVKSLRGGSLGHL